MRMNDSEIEAKLHTLTDDSLLMQVDGYSHIIHAEEESGWNTPSY